MSVQLLLCGMLLAGLVQHRSQHSCAIAVKLSSREILRGVVANVQDCNITGSEFKLQSRHSVYFLTNTLGKGLNACIHLKLWVKWYHNCSATRIALAWTSKALYTIKQRKLIMIVPLKTQWRLKNSLAEQDILIVCDQMKFIFHKSVCSCIGVAVLGSYW